MKLRIKGIMLLLVLIVPFLSSYCWLQYTITVTKQENGRNLATISLKDSLVVLKFSQTESRTKLRWEHPGEFEYRQQMYDIVKSEIQGDSIMYWCWWDREESKLKQQLRELLGFGPDPSDQNLPEERMFTFFKTLYCQSIFKWSPNGYVYQNPDHVSYPGRSNIFRPAPPIPPPEHS